MRAYDIILVVISGLGVIHGLFLALFLWGYQKGNPLSNKLLSALLLVLSFRVGKSVFLEFTDRLDIKIVFAGLSTIMAIGPLYYLFARSCTGKSFRLTWRHVLHFIPAMIGFIIGLLFGGASHADFAAGNIHHDLYFLLPPFSGLPVS
jgi:hypothetical protein